MTAEFSRHFPDKQKIVPTIALPQDRREFVRGLVRACQDDLSGKMLAPVQISDLKYKVEIMQDLLAHSRIDAPILSERIKQRDSRNYSWEVFANAWNVINDLIQTGGVNLENRGLLKVVRQV